MRTLLILFSVLIVIVCNIIVILYYKQQLQCQYGSNQQQVQLQQNCRCDHEESIDAMRLIMEEAKTDKGYTHAYYRTYGRLLAHLQNKRIRLLEIGVQDGKSLQAWIRYFPNYEHIYGIGFKNFQTEQKTILQDQNITLYMGDQSDVNFLKFVCSDAQNFFDIIIDDGSHFPQHQIISLQILINCLKPGGLYIVEDIETSYWNNPNATLYGNKFIGQGLYKNNTFIENSKNIIDVINREYHGQLQMNFWGVDKQIAAISFEQNLVVIRKVDKWDEGLHDRKYNCKFILCPDNQ